MSALDGLPKLSFQAIVFPAEQIILHSQGRQYLFEFPHLPGAVPEKLGRGIWCLSVKTYFAQGLRGYPATLYPDSMNQMRSLYEQQTTATFVHPTQGQFQAFISSWKQDYSPKFRNGERADIEFLEDQRVTTLASQAPSINNSAIVSTQSDFDNEIAKVRAQLNMGAPAQGLFDAIRATSNAISAIQGTAGMYTGLLQAKALELSSLCGQVDALPQMQSPLALGPLDALHNLWSAATQFTQPTSTPMSEWTVPQTMGVTDIATRLYGDASRASDILNLNGAVIADPYAVRAGTDIRYFP